MKISQKTPKAIVIHCSDPRFQEAFQGFISKNLNLSQGEYIPLVIPGSIAFLGGNISMFMPKNWKAIMDHLKEAMAQFRGREVRIILINHEGCAEYEKIVGRARKIFSALPDTIERQVEDLGTVAKVIEKLSKQFGVNCQIGLYMARVDKEEVVFDRYE